LWRGGWGCGGARCEFGKNMRRWGFFVGVVFLPIDVCRWPVMRGTSAGGENVSVTRRYPAPIASCWNKGFSYEVAGVGGVAGERARRTGVGRKQSGGRGPTRERIDSDLARE